ncbi:MAG: ferredoxin--NADP reductase [Candidatus Binataceae bacterium]
MTESSNAPPPATPRQRPISSARIERIFDHASDTRSLFLKIIEGTPLRFVPGMFISITLPLPNETRVRPYTITSSPEDGGPFEICFNRAPGGTGVAWLFERGVGAMVNFTGPFGAFTLDRAPEAELVFIAEGTAIAPIRPMIRRVLSQNLSRPVHLLYAADSDEHILYRDELVDLAAAHHEFHFETLIVEGDASTGDERLRAEVERRWVSADNERRRHFYVCGVGRGVLTLRNLLRGAGYERRAVHYEQW